MKLICSTLFCLFLFTFSINAQVTIEPPTEGKSVIYFMRTSGVGGLLNFRFFDNTTYLGKFKGVNYMRYECEPGEHMFWVKAENTDYLEANLEAGKIYFVEANGVPGLMTVGVKYKLVDYSHKRQFKRIQKLMAKKEPKVFTEEELKTDQEKFKLIIKDGLATLERKRNRGKKLKRLEKDNNYKN
ncbi:hypothetical protein [uncultured Psychroserpens sp.]|uniref:hypothetical protein n=1 Tax=uncultured Psychroserpens sp. TaxID=255436 RepID=UPI0026243724|nr:hypothetical protein [uncultured Psychroserpens sp.]